MKNPGLGRGFLFGCVLVGPVLAGERLSLLSLLSRLSSLATPSGGDRKGKGCWLDEV
jgi:hypothetical protein